MSPRHKRKPGTSARTGRRRRGRQAARRVEALFDRLHERNDPAFDQRSDERPPPARNLAVRENRELFDRLVTLDFEYLMALRFAADPATLSLLLPQSVLGRAQNGHGWFRDEDGTPLRFPAATFDRVLSVLERLDPALRNDAVRCARSRRLEELSDYLLAAASRAAVKADSEGLHLEVGGAPLFGVEFLAGVTVDTRAFLTGLILAGFMDDFRHREMTLSYRPICFDGSALQIGGGSNYLVRPEQLAALGIVDAGQGEFDDRAIGRLGDLGVIVADPGDGYWDYPTYDQVFFRRRLGEGVSDDLALLYVAARYGEDALFGAFVMDAVDTYDKFLSRFAGQGFDTRLAAAIQARFVAATGAPLVGGEAILDTIHFAAKANTPTCPLSSSHRRFIQNEPGADVPTLLNHVRFLHGDPVFDIELGYARFPARKFYAIARDRLMAAGTSIPEPSFIRRK